MWLVTVENIPIERCLAKPLAGSIPRIITLPESVTAGQHSKLIGWLVARSHAASRLAESHSLGDDDLHDLIAPRIDRLHGSIGVVA